MSACRCLSACYDRYMHVYVQFYGCLYALRGQHKTTPSDREGFTTQSGRPLLSSNGIWHTQLFVRSCPCKYPKYVLWTWTCLVIGTHISVVHLHPNLHRSAGKSESLHRSTDPVRATASFSSIGGSVPRRCNRRESGQVLGGRKLSSSGFSSWLYVHRRLCCHST